MTQTFAPQEHLIKLPRRVKDQQTGQWITRHDDYLEVKWRLVWFRERYPHGVIMTDAILLDWDKGIAIYKATVEDGEGGKATGTGTETRKGFEDFVEKAETRSIGRALAALGIGTQFVGEELSEGEHVADAPVAPAASLNGSSTGEKSAAAGNGHPSEPVSSNGHAPERPQVTGAHPTPEQIEGLFVLALETCGEDPDNLSTRIRQVMNVPAHASTSKRLLPKTMSGEQFDRLWTYYQTLLAQLQRQTEVVNAKPKGKEATTRADHPAPPQTPQPAPAPTGETPADPTSAAESSSASARAPDADAVDQAYHKLYQEALGWGVAEPEIKHVLDHHRDLAKCRTILWKARRNEPSPQWEKVPAA